jgi:hypothetical protein
MGSASGGFWAKLLLGGVGAFGWVQGTLLVSKLEVRTDERRDL